MTPAVTLLLVFVIMVALEAVQRFAPPVYPVKTYNVLGLAVFTVTLCFTFFRIPLYPPPGSVKPWVVVSVLLVLAVAAPILGLVESRRRPDGQAVYCTGVLPGTANRFPGHLLTNLLGALAACAFWWVAHSAPGFVEFLAKFPYDAAFNVMVPLSAAAAFTFVRWQQVDACRKVDVQIEKVMEHPDGEAKIVGFSLRHWHQQANFLHLVAVTSMASTSFLFLVAYGMRQTKHGHPAVSWPVIVTILATLGSLYACGAPWSRENKAVYLTFLTGTPAALGGAILWLSWFRDDATRNATMVSVAVIGYVLYCVEAVFADWGKREGRLPLHYFAPTTVAVVIAVLLGIAYLAN